MNIDISKFKDVDNSFRKDKEDYKNNMDPLRHYGLLSGDFISTIMDKTHDEAKEMIKGYIKENKRFNNPKVLFYERDEKANRDKKITTLKDYIYYPKKENDIIAPSFTVYFNPTKLKSLHAEFIDVNVKARSKHKKLAFKFKVEKDFQQFNYHNTLQKAMKIFNNSLSGAYASAGTVLNNPSAHYTLTSMTRCISGIGNSLSESIIKGNRHYRNPDVMLNHLLAIVRGLDTDLVNKVIQKYRLHIPTAEEVMNSLSKSFYKYWKDPYKESLIYEYLNKINGIERAKILYHLDLYHLKEYNEEFVRDMINKFIKYESLDLIKPDVEAIINNAPAWLINLAKHVFFEEVKGLKDSDIPKATRKEIASYLLNVTDSIIKYRDIFHAFFITSIFPVSIAYLKDMVRESIVLSDTDSTCASYSHWVEWYIGKHEFGPTAYKVSASVMTIVTQAIDHYIKDFATNLNITYEDAQVLEMKNEFTWDVFVNTNVSKHYFANVRIQEGNVYNFEDPSKYLERKGVHLIVSQAYEPIREIAEKMMLEIMWKVNNNEKIDLNDYINQTIKAEIMVTDKIKEGSPDVLKLEKVKEAKSYKAEPERSPYFHYLLWQDVFADEYGEAPNPTYMAIKVPTTINSKQDMMDFIETLDSEYKEKYLQALRKYGKETIKSYKLPLIITYNKGIPKILHPILDIRRAIMDNCKVLYIILESIGFYVKEGQTLSEMVKYGNINNDLHNA